MGSDNYSHNLSETYQKRYSAYLYSGLHGLLMRQSHRLLSKNACLVDNANVLEVGGGLSPHFLHVNLQGVKNYVIEDMFSDETLRQIEVYNDRYPFSIMLSHIDSDASRNPNIRYSRVVSSHCWEHIPDPEKVLLDWAGRLEPAGLLSILIPCDPGILWKLASYVSKWKYRRLYGVSYKEFDLMMDREHINGCQRLVRFFKYHFPHGTVKKFPFPFLPMELNLFIKLEVRNS